MPIGADRFDTDHSILPSPLVPRNHYQVLPSSSSVARPEIVSIPAGVFLMGPVGWSEVGLKHMT
jgi:hypothetical protein